MGREIDSVVSVSLVQVADIADELSLKELEEVARAAAETKVVGAPGGGGTLVLQHLATVSCPLPAAMVLAARLQHLPTSMTAEWRPKAVAGQELPAQYELLALLDLVNIASLREGGLNQQLGEEEGGGGGGESHPVVLAIEAIRKDLRRRIGELAKRILRKGIMPARAAPNIPELQAELPGLERARERVVKLCKLSMGRVDTVVGSTVCAVTFLWLVGKLRHANASSCALCPEAWPISGNVSSHGRDWEAVLLDDDSGKNEFLGVYRDKMSMWGCWLLCQWAISGVASLDDISQFGKESVSLRNEYCWSVPTEEALDLLAANAPLIEIGAGRGVWSELLGSRGVDVKAFDTLKWQSKYNDANIHAEGDALITSRSRSVQEGGPEVLAQPENKNRTLVLMWPDYMGKGSYGMDCLNFFEGDTLILVGEWASSSIGSYTAGVPETGQSFNPAFQQQVEEKFEKKGECSLPKWPLFFDSLVIWKRKSS